MKRKMSKWIRRSMAFVLAGMIAMSGAGVAVMQVQADTVTGNDVEGPAPTDSQMDTAKSDIATYANNLIVSHNLTGSDKKKILDMLDEARYKIGHDYNHANGYAEMQNYVSNVRSMMDAVIAAALEFCDRELP